MAGENLEVKLGTSVATVPPSITAISSEETVLTPSKVGDLLAQIPSRITLIVEPNTLLSEVGAEVVEEIYQHPLTAKANNFVAN